MKRLLPLAVTFLGCYPVELPGLHLERMIEQPKLRAYDGTDFFADGRAMRPPPEGTVARDDVIEPASLTEGVQGGAPVRDIPLPVSRKMIERGRDHFDRVCAACHGIAGDGRSVVAEKMRLRRPPSLVDQDVTQMAAGEVFRVISQGYGLMPSFAARFSPTERWEIVAYLRALQLSRGARLDQLPVAIQREAEQVLP